MMKDRQDLKAIFDKVSDHLLQQNRKSYLSGCRYRTPDGRSCAIGCLIPDNIFEIHGKEIEGLTVSKEPVKKVLENCGLPVDDKAIDMYTELQIIHDMHSVETWKSCLDNLRKEYFDDEVL